MKQNDAIETVKQNTYVRYNMEDGVWDILLGFGMVFLALCLQYNMLSFFGLFAVFAPMITRILKRKYVYPRIGVVLFRKYPKAHRPRIIMGSIFVIIISFIGVAFTLYTKASPIITFAYSYPWGFIILAILIAGGIMQDNKFYLYAFMMCIPIYFTHLFNTNTYYRSITVILLVVLLICMEKIVKKGTVKKTIQIKQRYARFEHDLVIVLSVIGGIALYFNMKNVSLANQLRDFGLTHLSIVIGNFVAFLLLVIGMAFTSFRYILYGFLLSAIVFIPYLIADEKANLWHFLLSLGVFIISIGITVLMRFIKKYPVLEVTNETK